MAFLIATILLCGQICAFALKTQNINTTSATLAPTIKSDTVKWCALDSAYAEDYYSQFTSASNASGQEDSITQSENFELDTIEIRLVDSSSDDGATASESSTGDTIVNFLKKNWMWLVIALVALLILVIIIVIIARKKKDDNNGKRNNNPPYPPYNNGGGRPPYPPYNGGQPYYPRRPPVMPMAGMIPPQMQGRPGMNGAMQPQIGMQAQLQGGMQMQGNQPQIQGITQPNQAQYVEDKSIPALNAPNQEHIASSGVGALVEEIYRLRGEVEHIKSKSEEETIKLRAEVENARTMSAVESAKRQAISEIERAKNEAKFAMQSSSISEAAATTVSGRSGAGDVLGDALMSAVAKMIVQGSINGAANNAAVTPAAQPIHDNASNIQNNTNVIPQCPPGARMTTTTMVDMTNTANNNVSSEHVESVPNNNANTDTVPRSSGRTGSVATSGGVNGNPFEVNGLYEKYYGDKGAADDLLKPHEHGLYEKYYDDEN